MQRRLTLSAAGLLIGGLLSLLPAAAATAVEASLDVPDAPSGDVIVVAHAGPGWPYVQVQLVRPNVPATASPIAPAPVPNDGAGVPVEVPSWGVDGPASFVLLGCTAADAATCSTVLSTRAVDITQTLLPTATIDVPSEPVLVPQEDVLVRVDNPGGGRMLARGQELTNHAEQVFTDYRADLPRASVGVRRCSALTSSTSYCEYPVAVESFDFVGPDTMVVVSQDRLLTLDPDWHTSSSDLLVYSAGYEHDLSWSLFNSQGEQVLGPVQVADNSVNGLDHVTLNVGRSAAGPIPDGTYAVRFTATFAKASLTGSTSEDQEFRIVNDPPADSPSVTARRRVVRPGAAGGPETARFLVQAYPGSLAGGTLRLRNHHGRVVQTRTVQNPCSPWWPAGDCDQTPTWRVSVHGWSDTGRPLRSGRYIAQLKMPDSYGRMMVTQLGPVFVR